MNISTAVGQIEPNQGCLATTSYSNPNFKFLQRYVTDYLNGYFLQGLEDERFEEPQRIINSFTAQCCLKAAEEIGHEPVSSQELRVVAKKLAIDVLKLQSMFLVGATDAALAVFGTARDPLWEQFPSLKTFTEILGREIATRMSISCGGFDTGSLKDLLSAFLNEPNRKSLYGPTLNFTTDLYQQQSPEPPVVAGAEDFAPPFDSIYDRTPTIICAANLIGELFNPGTWGTLQEWADSSLGKVNGSINQTVFSPRYQVPHPIFLLDPKVGSTTFYEGTIKQSALFGHIQPERSAMLIDNLLILREDSVYRIKKTNTADELSLEKICDFGFENDPQALTQYMIVLMEQTKEKLKSAGVIWDFSKVSDQLNRYKEKIKELEKPLPEFPMLRTSEDIIKKSEIVNFIDSLQRFQQDGWSIDPVMYASEAAKGSSYPGKPTSFGTVFKVQTYTKDGQKSSVIYPVGANIAESGRDTNCAERVAYGNLCSYLDCILPEGTTFKIEAVHIHLDQKADFRFSCSCQNCRQLFQDLVQKGQMALDTKISYQAGNGTDILVTTIDKLVPLINPTIDIVNQQDRYIPSSFEFLPSEDEWTSIEKGFITAAINSAVKSKNNIGVASVLLDGSILSRSSSERQFGFELLRQESKATKGNNIHLGFVYAVNQDEETDLLPTFPPEQLDILLTAAQISGFDTPVYVVQAVDGKFRKGYRINISDLFPLGKGMGDSKAGDDHYHRMSLDRIWNGVPFDGTITQEIANGFFGNSRKLN